MSESSHQPPSGARSELSEEPQDSELLTAKQPATTFGGGPSCSALRDSWTDETDKLFHSGNLEGRLDDVDCPSVVLLTDLVIKTAKAQLDQAVRLSGYDPSKSLGFTNPTCKLSWTEYDPATRQCRVVLEYDASVHEKWNNTPKGTLLPTHEVHAVAEHSVIQDLQDQAGKPGSTGRSTIVADAEWTIIDAGVRWKSDR